MKLTIKCLIVIGFMLFLATPTHAMPGYLCLKAYGNEMASTICNRDIVYVQVGTDVSLINSGSRANPNSGDVVVYFAAWSRFHLGTMWTCGRVINKYYQNGHWYFETKLDNQTDPDPVEVPDYLIFGIVVDVIPNGNTSDKESTAATNPQHESPTTKEDPRFGLPEFPTLVFEFSVGIALGLILGLTIRKLISKRSIIKESDQFTYTKELVILSAKQSQILAVF